MDVTKPYKSTGLGAMDVTKSDKFIGFGAMDVTKPHKFIRFGAMDVTKPYKFKKVWGPTSVSQGGAGASGPAPAAVQSS